ncbi:P1 family peptidase [Sphingosinicella microcystinivorans]|nr:P1 family peptidase [Sphingosinicella microcystinivorans]
MHDLMVGWGWMVIRMTKCRYRDLALTIGQLPTGPLNAITDVAGVRVGHVTRIEESPRILRTGVTAIQPLGVPYWQETVFAGFHSYNGFGEVTGSHWIAETGILTSPICMSSAFSVGVLRDTLLAHPKQNGIDDRWHQPMAGETFDGVLNDGWDGPVTRADVIAALDAAAGGPVAEGSIGGGTGMMSFEFKSGIGTSSRVTATTCGSFTVGALVQSNFGNRSELTVDGVPVGRHLGYEVVDSPQRRDQGSIVIVLATDAPLLPPQCARLARRGGIGLARVGGFGSNRSGDFIVAFSTGNRVPFNEAVIAEGLRMLPNEAMNPLFRAASEAVEEAIINSMTMSDSMTGVDGTTVHALPNDKLVEVMQRYGRGPASAT